MAPKVQAGKKGAGGGAGGGGQYPKPPPQKGGPSKQPGKQPPNQTDKPKPKPAKKKKNCPRCYEGMIATNPTTNHDLADCSKLDRFSDDNNIHKLWQGCRTVGEKERASIKSAIDAEELLQDVFPSQQGTFRGEPVTKHLLEKAFQKLYNLKGENQANVERKKIQKHGQSTGGSSSGARAAASAPDGPSNSKSAQQTKELIPDGVSLLSQANPIPRMNDVVLSLGRYPVDDSLCSKAPPKNHSSDQPMLVTTNHVAVKKQPSTVFVYSISYGTTSEVLTGREAKAQDEKNVKTEDDEQATELSAKAQDLTLEQQAENAGPNEQATATSDQADGGDKKIAQRSEKARVFKQLRQRTELQSIRWATDYQLLWTLEKLPATSETISDIEYPKLSGKKYCLKFVQFAFVKELSLGAIPSEATKMLINHTLPEKADEATEKGASMRITALNAFVSDHVSLANDNIIPVGPNKFFLKDGWTAMKTDPTLNITRGYFTSIRPGSKSALLNINVATSAFFNPMSIADYLSYFSQRDREKAQKLIKGLNIRIAYEREKHQDQDYDPNLEYNRHRIVAGWGLKPSEQTFEQKGTTVTVAEYFDTLGYSRIQYPDYPCVSVNIAPRPDGDDQDSKNRGKQNDGQSKPKARPQWILPELLHIDPYQPFKKLLPPACTEDMIHEAVRPPAKTQHMIISEGFKALGMLQDPSPFCQLGLRLGDKLLQVPARQLITPRIAYSGNRDDVWVKAASWNLSAGGQKKVRFFSSPPHPISKAVLIIDLRRAKVQDSDDFGKELTGQMIEHGFKFADNIKKAYRYIDLSAHRANDIELYEKLSDKLKESGRPELAVVLLDRKEAEPYGAIKRVCDQWAGLHTVCVTDDKIQDDDDRWQIIGNLALKMNIKLRGQNHQICQPKEKSNPRKITPFFEGIADDTIVFGADVSHAGSDMPSTPSVAAVVANDDKDFVNFPASMRLQASRQERIEQLGDMVYYRLLRFIDSCGFLPKRMLFYRDGVSEDQFQMCRDEEMAQIYGAYNDVMKENPSLVVGPPCDASDYLQLTFVVVGKRHHTRFFAQDKNQSYPPNSNRPNGNLHPGIVVEDIVTRPDVGDGISDFFLQSHAALKGTARAGHYTILQLQGFSVDELQRLTHAFCYNYMRATKGVSYVGPAYYADRLCERGTHYLRGYINDLDKDEMKPTDEQKKSKQGMSAFAREVVTVIDNSEWWRPAKKRGDDEYRDPNPWHPAFDNCMFWL